MSELPKHRSREVVAVAARRQRFRIVEGRLCWPMTHDRLCLRGLRLLPRLRCHRTLTLSGASDAKAPRPPPACRSRPRPHRARANQAHVERDLDRNRPAARRSAAASSPSRPSSQVDRDLDQPTSRTRSLARPWPASAGDNATTAIRGGTGSFAGLVHQAHVECDLDHFGQQHGNGDRKGEFRHRTGDSKPSARRGAIRDPGRKNMLHPAPASAYYAA